MGNNSFSDALHNDPAGFIRRLIRGISRGDHLRENREFFQFLLHNRLRLLSGFNAELEHVLPYSLDEKYLIETGWMIIQLMVEVLIFNELTETLKRAYSRAFLRPLIGWISIYIMLSVCTDSEISSKSYTSTTDVQNFIKCLNGEKLLAYINSRAILTEITAQRFAPLYHQVVLEITGHCKRFLETIIQGGLTKIGKKIASCIPICEQSAHPHSYSNAADFDLPDSIPLSSNSNSVIALNSRAYEWGCYPISNLDPSSGQFHYKLADEVEIFVEPELLYTDYMTHQSYTINIDDLTQPQLRYIIVAPPGHGKTRLQREMAIRAQHQIHTFINAVDFANSGIRDIYGFSARMIADIWQIPPQNLLSIRNELEIRDQTNEIFWHIDDWDLVPRHQRGDMAISLSPLKSFSVTTVYPDDVASFFPYSSTDPQLVVFRGAVHIQPLNNTQCEKLLSIYYDIYNENIDIKKTLALVEKLPGFSQSVPGMRHLIQCAGDNEMNSLAITEGFIWGQPLSSAREIIRWSFDLWERTPKNLPPDLSTNDELFDLNPDDVIAKMRYQSRPDIPSIVNQWFSDCVKTKLIYKISDNRYRFVIPEIGYYLIAENTLKNKGFYALFFANHMYRSQPRHSFSHILLLYAIREACKKG